MSGSCQWSPMSGLDVKGDGVVVLNGGSQHLQSGVPHTIHHHLSLSFPLSQSCPPFATYYVHLFVFVILSHCHSLSSHSPSVPSLSPSVSVSLSLSLSLSLSHTHTLSLSIPS